MRYLVHLLAVLTCLLAVALPAAAAETIRNFAAGIHLRADGSVAVTETITVNAEGDDIRRGIYRDIPTVLIHDDGTRLRSNLDVLSVERDGQPEPWFTEGIENGTRIYIGDEDVLLDDGTYRYTISYTMTRMARRFETHDELYWNATGNFWDFPIENAVATVTLPEGAVIEDLAGFTGKFGSLEQSVSVTRETDNRAIFRAGRELAPYEGMSVAAKFQKGILAEPDAAQKAAYFLSDYRGIILPLIAVFVVLLYNYFAWDAVGRDPKRGVIFPRFYPPEGYSPALVNYVHRWGFNKNGWLAFTAAIVSLGVKGLIDIDEVGKKTRLTVKGDIAEEKLPPGEAVLWRYLNGKGSVTIDKTTGSEIASRKGEFTSAIEAENRGVYFNNNILYIAGGVILSLAALFVLVWADALDPVWMFFAVFGGMFIGLAAGFFSSIWRGGAFVRFVTIFWAGLFITNLLGGASEIFASGSSFNLGVWSAMSIIIINVVFAVLMRAPTVQGRKIMDWLDGFKMYLETAEKERLNFQNEPDMSVKRYEEILPYAIALGVEKPWSERFENDLARHAVTGADSVYTPRWYHGSRGFAPHTIGRDVAALASGMSAAMIAAQPASSSSSGFSGGGGGGSGGGGGGGGGGGW